MRVELCLHVVYSSRVEAGVAKLAGVAGRLMQTPTGTPQGSAK